MNKRLLVYFKSENILIHLWYVGDLVLFSPAASWMIELLIEFKQFSKIIVINLMNKRLLVYFKSENWFRRLQD